MCSSVFVAFFLIYTKLLNYSYEVGNKFKISIKYFSNKYDCSNLPKLCNACYAY